MRKLYTYVKKSDHVNEIFTVALIDINYTDRGYMTCGEKQGMQYHRYLNEEAGYKRERKLPIFAIFTHLAMALMRGLSAGSL